MTTTIEPDELEARIEQLEAELDEASDKIRELTEERDELKRRHDELEEKVDTAKDTVEELARELNR
ncbi:V-type ATPase 116kDa subunit family protein [Streptomyces chartreusis]|uniref:V-type ATPase 116kDa subunit family protein n=1 Tax=Streptomyces chartreusis TaxID=1969 RepID=UPI00142F14EF|nr:V-type ATPase 116kDa subunit family protein [Streptomyces chartreusis]GGW99138.1 hypothetical protein GCM10010321_12020 [Streptomyces chartreusis]